MREDVVTPATARRLRRAGLVWEPQMGDWCIVMGGEHLGEGQPGLWLVAALAPAAGLVGVMDAAGEWPMARVPAFECVWLPSAGKLKTWLRAHGYRVATGEADPATLGTGPRHVCRLTRPGDAAPIQTDGSSEAEAVAEAVLRVLAAWMPEGEASDGVQAAPGGWITLPETPTRRL